MPEDLPDRMPEDMPEDMPEHMPEDMPDRMPDRMPEDMPDRMPEGMPDRMPDKMSDGMPEDLPVTKCINVMVGITRSKVILFHSFSVALRVAAIHVKISSLFSFFFSLLLLVSLRPLLVEVACRGGRISARPYVAGIHCCI